MTDLRSLIEEFLLNRGYVPYQGVWTYHSEIVGNDFIEAFKHASRRFKNP